VKLADWTYLAATAKFAFVRHLEPFDVGLVLERFEVFAVKKGPADDVEDVAEAANSAVGDVNVRTHVGLNLVE
jgi:hypothetical protein